jgi:mono/diheme cytochrome c family protein
VSADLRWLRAIVFAAPLALTACEWFTDFKRQPSLATWEVVGDSTHPSRGNPQGSVPTSGLVKADFEISLTNRINAVDSFTNVPNPNPVTDASLENGRKYYQINCAVCHGDAGGDPKGLGDGPVAKIGLKYSYAVTSLRSEQAMGRSDGYLFGMIRNGRGNMPPYNRIDESDRWDVVNYVRGLQGKLGREVATGPLAKPGVTGDKLPGVSRVAPTRPVPFFNLHKRTTAMPAMERDSAADSAKKSGGHR